MKTKAFLLFCLLLGLGLTQLHAQNGKDGTGSIRFDWSNPYVIPVICDGVQVDYLTGWVPTKVTAHFDRGILSFYIITFHCEFTSDKTGEVFKYQEKDRVGEKITSDAYPIVFFHGVLIGNKGTHYVIEAVWNDEDSTIEITKAICH
jgi:hypothetical protein